VQQADEVEVATEDIETGRDTVNDDLVDEVQVGVVRLTPAAVPLPSMSPSPARSHKVAAHSGTGPSCTSHGWIACRA
jgi:hypothetical protein